MPLERAERPGTDAAAGERLDRLRFARDQLVARLEDPSTPGYSVAPLSNQLRLVDREIERLTVPVVDDGLPSSPDRAGLCDFMLYRRRLRRRGFVSPPRRSLNAWATAYEAILAGWEAAGFVPPDRGPGEDRDVWVDRCRAGLRQSLSARSRHA